MIVMTIMAAYVGRHLAVVADGMGGHAGGDVASAATVLDLAHLDTRGSRGTPRRCCPMRSRPRTPS